jgi:hypothetical protein
MKDIKKVNQEIVKSVRTKKLGHMHPIWSPEFTQFGNKSLVPLKVKQSK